VEHLRDLSTKMNPATAFPRFAPTESIDLRRWLMCKFVISKRLDRCRPSRSGRIFRSSGIWITYNISKRSNRGILNWREPKRGALKSMKWLVALIMGFNCEPTDLQRARHIFDFCLLAEKSVYVAHE
jgi:hypothetical protein